MTTTELYSGYTADGKPSSRVLRPPGGASSNIFGESEPSPQQQVKQEQQKEAQAGNQQAKPQTKANPTSDAKQEYNRNKPQGRSKYNPITGEEYPEDYGKQQKGKGEEEETGNNENPTEATHAVNTSPTRQVEDKKPETFQKVRQPPGGKSSGLW